MRVGIVAAGLIGAVAAMPLAAQQTTSPGGFRLQPDDGRAPGVQGPADNGIPPAAPGESREASEVAPAPPPRAPAPRPSEPTERAAAPAPRGDERSAPVSSSPTARRDAARATAGDGVPAGQRRDTARDDALATGAPTTADAPADTAATGDASGASSSLPLSPITGRVLTPQTGRIDMRPLWAIALALVAALVALWWWMRRRRSAAAPVMAAAAPAPAPAAPRDNAGDEALVLQPAPPAAPLVTRPAAEMRARLTMRLEVLALTLTPEHLAVRFALHLANEGAVAAEGVFVRIALQQAEAGQDEMITNFFGGAGGSMLQSEFDMAPGARDALQGEAMLPLAAIPPLTIANRAALVPVLAFDVTYHWAGDADAFGQVASAFVLGQEPDGGGDRLGPVWLDRAAHALTRPGARATRMQAVA